MQKDELARQKKEKLDKLNELITNTKESAKSISKDMRDKLELLKVCYDRASSKQKNKVHELINYTQLRCYLAGEQFSNSYETKPIELKHIVYTPRSINRHKESGLPDENNWQAIDIYSFYFGGYRAFFRCFTKEFLELRIKQKKEFIEDVFSQKDIDSEETGLNQHIVSCQKLNIIPSIRTEKSVLRIDILENLFILFQNNKKVAITGISGIGKTFLAKHFTEYYEGKFSNMVWLNCANGFPKAFSQEKGIGLLGSLGLANEYHSYVGNDKGLMNLLIGHLAKIEGNNLLVLDNLDDSIYNHKDEIELLSKNWNILGTSQQQLQGFENYITPDFQKEALDLFYTFYTIEKDDDNLIRLLSAIEYHTLAIELLAKTAQERNLRIIALVNRFTKKGINVVAQVEIEAEHGIERKKTTIENIEDYLGIIFDTSSLKEEQCKILLNIALLQEDSIPMDLFQEVYLNNTCDEDKIDIFRYNLKAITKKGWVKAENERIRLHGLVKNTILKRFFNKYEFFESTIRYLVDELKIGTQKESKKIEYLKLSELLLENYPEETKDITYLKFAVSHFLHKLGLYEKAENIFHELQETEDIVINIGKLHNLSISAFNQDNHEKALFYSNQVHSLFDDETRKELYFFVNNALITFLTNNNIEIPFDFEKNEWLASKIQVMIMVLNCQSIIIMCETDKDILKKIEELKQLLSIIDELLSILEKNISPDILFSIRSFEDLFVSKDSISRKIGMYYADIKEYIKSEEFLTSTLWIKENYPDRKNFNLSLNYNALTYLYLSCENLEKAKYYIEKNRKICESYPYNHPDYISYRNDLARLEKIEKEKNLKKELPNKIKSQFEILFQKNPDSTFLWEYYYTLSCIYYEFNNIEKALEYARKEVRSLSNIHVNDWLLVNSYVRLGMTSLRMGNFEEAVKSHNQAQDLYNEKQMTDRETQKRIFDFKEYIFETAFKENYLRVIRHVVRNELINLQQQYCNSFSELLSPDELLEIFNKIINFLSDLPDIKDVINWGNTAEDWIETLDKKADEFFVEYSKVFDINIQEVTDIKPSCSFITEMKYHILCGYYQKVADIFSKYEKWGVAVQYYLRKFFLFKSWDVTHYEFVGNVFQEISNCFSRLERFELSYMIIKEGINFIDEFLEDENNTIEYKENFKKALKELITMEKTVKEKLAEFKK